MTLSRLGIKLISVAFSIALSACVGGPRDNHVVLSGGIGGTGLSTWEGGIGGTGVVGTITGFGSIIVNGLHISYDVNQSVENLVGPMTGADFAIGQVVAAETRVQNGRLVAERLVAHTPLVGRIESINPAAHELSVLGETVHVMAYAKLGMANFSDMRVGDAVMVSGYRGQDGVYASRIDNAPAPTRTGLSGTVTDKTAASVTIDARRTIRLSTRMLSRLTIGDYVELSDIQREASGEFMARSATRAYGPMFDGRVNRMVVEGIFGPDAQALPGIGRVKGAPTGRAVVFVSKGPDGTIVMDGATQRPEATWQDNLSIEMRSPDSPGSSHSANAPSGSSGGSSGGGGGGGGGGDGGSGGGGGNGGGR